jgi:hypothetical protein
MLRVDRPEVINIDKIEFLAEDVLELNAVVDNERRD